MKSTVLKLFVLSLFLLSIVAVPVVAQEPENDEVLLDLLNQLEQTNDVEDTTVEEDTTETDTPDDTTPAPEDETEHNAAEDILDALGGSFEYAGPEVITVPQDMIEADSVVIKTTKVTHEGEDVMMYRAYYSTNTLADFLDVSDLKEEDLEVMKVEGTTVELKLEGLDAATTYFLIVAPINPTDPTADPLEMISDEVRFTTSAAAIVVDDMEVMVEEGTTDNGMYVHDVSYTYADNKVTLTWTPSQEVTTVGLSIKKSDTNTYVKLADVPATAGKYTFTAQEAGLHLVKIETKGADGELMGKEQIQSVKIDDVVVPEVIVEAVPEVGPATNLMIALMIFALIMGVGYNVRRQEQ